MPQYTLTLPVKLVINNQLHRMHWAKKARYQSDLVWQLIAAMGRNKPPKASQHRTLSIMACVKRFQDDDNFIGSLKPLIDALRDKKVGLLVDDNAEWLTLSAEQKKAKDYSVEISIRWT